MNAQHLMRRAAENNAWANHRLHAVCARLSDDELRAPRTSFFPSIHGTLTHIALVDAYYLEGLEALAAPEQGRRGLATRARRETRTCI